jgi:hypothetical protein
VSQGGVGVEVEGGGEVEVYELNIIESATLHTTLTLPAGYVYISIYVRRYSSLYCKSVHACMETGGGGRVG